MILHKKGAQKPAKKLGKKGGKSSRNYLNKKY